MGVEPSREKTTTAAVAFVAYVATTSEIEVESEKEKGKEKPAPAPVVFASTDVRLRLGMDPNLWIFKGGGSSGQAPKPKTRGRPKGSKNVGGDRKPTAQELKRQRREQMDHNHRRNLSNWLARPVQTPPQHRLLGDDADHHVPKVLDGEHMPQGGEDSSGQQEPLEVGRETQGGGVRGCIESGYKTKEHCRRDKRGLRHL